MYTESSIITVLMLTLNWWAYDTPPSALKFYWVQHRSLTILHPYGVNLQKKKKKYMLLLVTLTEKNYWDDNSYYSDLEVTIYGQ